MNEPEPGLGLRPGRVELVESDPRWPAAYRRYADKIEDACAEITVELAHIGSTSVPGLPAKPVIDIAIGVTPPIDNEDFIGRLATCGFDFVADLGDYGGVFFTASTDEGVVTSHVHLVGTDNFQWTWYVAFRDALRADADLRSKYAALKRRAASAHADDREAYTKAKSDWLLATVRHIADES